MRLQLAAVAVTCLTAAACSDQPVTAPAAGAPRLAAAAAAAAFPDVIALPNGFGPEGIDFGKGTTFYVGSIAGGAIWRGDARTGAGAILVPADPARQASGIEYDRKDDRLFVAGGLTGQAYVYDAATGATLATYQLRPPFTGLVNDVVVLKDAAYFTDSFNAVLFRVPLGKNGALLPGAVPQAIPLGGDFAQVGGFGVINANGIAATPNGKDLVIVNSATGALFRVDPASGHATLIPVAGGPIVGGDGLVLDGKDLYVVQGSTGQQLVNRVAVVRLNSHLTAGAVQEYLTDPDLAFPSTAAEFGGALYVVNAHFDQAPPPAPAPANLPFEVVRLPKK